jgi:hypothetical protein
VCAERFARDVLGLHADLLWVAEQYPSRIWDWKTFQLWAHNPGQLSWKIELPIDKTCAVCVAASRYRAEKYLQWRSGESGWAAEAPLFLDGVFRKDGRRRRTDENHSLFRGGRLARWSWQHEHFGWKRLAILSSGTLLNQITISYNTSPGKEVGRCCSKSKPRTVMIQQSDPGREHPAPLWSLFGEDAFCNGV